MFATIHFTSLSSPLRCKNLKFKIHKIKMLPAILFGYAISFLTVRNVDTSRVRVLGNRGVLRGIFGPETKEMTGGWK
jgi:hypothetical protein